MNLRGLPYVLRFSVLGKNIEKMRPALVALLPTLVLSLLPDSPAQRLPPRRTSVTRTNTLSALLALVLVLVAFSRSEAADPAALTQTLAASGASHVLVEGTGGLSNGSPPSRGAVLSRPVDAGHDFD